MFHRGCRCNSFFEASLLRADTRAGGTHSRPGDYRCHAQTKGCAVVERLSTINIGR